MTSGKMPDLSQLRGSRGPGNPDVHRSCPRASRGRRAACLVEACWPLPAVISRTTDDVDFDATKFSSPRACHLLSVIAVGNRPNRHGVDRSIRWAETDQAGSGHREPARKRSCSTVPLHRPWPGEAEALSRQKDLATCRILNGGKIDIAAIDLHLAEECTRFADRWKQVKAWLREKNERIDDSRPTSAITTSATIPA